MILSYNQQKHLRMRIQQRRAGILDQQEGEEQQHDANAWT